MKEREREKQPDIVNEEPKREQNDWAKASSWFEKEYYGAPSGEKRIVDAAGQANAKKAQQPEKEHSGDKKSKNPKLLTQLNSRTKKKKETERYRKAVNSAKSNDELRKEYAIHAKNRRKLKVAWLVIFSFLLFVGMLLAISLTFLFKVDDIQVTGSKKYDAQQIIEASEINKGDNLLLTTSQKVTDKVSGILPYVKSVNVKRDLPDKITLEVDETCAAYAIKNKKKYILIDLDGKVLESDAKKAGKATVITGVKVEKAEVCADFETNDIDNYEAAKRIITGASENKLSLTQLDVKNLNAITAIYNDIIKLDFGGRTELERKIEMARSVIQNLKKDNALHEGVINLKGVSKAFYKEESIK